MYDVYRAHFDQLVRAVTHPTTLITVLYSKKLISDTVKTELTTLTGVGDMEKATRLMNAVEITMIAAPRASRVVLDLCEAVDDEPALKHVADSIRSALGEMIGCAIVVTVMSTSRVIICVLSHSNYLLPRSTCPLTHHYICCYSTLS